MLALLALIGLKKFRSFQKPNRIAKAFDAFDGSRAKKTRYEFYLYEKTKEVLKPTPRYDPNFGK